MNLKAILAVLFASVFLSCSCSHVPHASCKLDPIETINITAKIPQPGHIDLKEEITDEVADRITAALTANPGRVVIDIDSPGGGVEAGLKIIEAIHDHKTPVICRVNGRAASMAFVVLESCGVREATDQSLFMGHSVSARIETQGHSTDISQAAANAAAAMKAISRALAYHVCHRIPGLPIKTCMDSMSDGSEFWISANDLLAVGGLDLIVP